MTESVPLLAITMGDPAGIGPEIIAKACNRLGTRLADGEFRVLVIGHRSAMREATRSLGMADLPEPLEPVQAYLPVSFLAAGEEREAIEPGRVSPEAGRFAYLALKRAVEFAQEGVVDAIVTAPLNKEALNRAGYNYAGHTELLAKLTDAPGSVMLLAHGDMRVGHVTTHVALADVPRRLTPERLLRTIRLTHDVMRDLGFDHPRLGVAALNPHAGEGGLFGREDLEITAPVVEACRAEGMEIAGPIPGDTVFVKLRARQFDAVIAMYHDQGHIPVKLLGFDVDPATGTWRALSGVNVTLGLPVIRTSVDHGTAFDIAGKGIGSEESLIEAIEFALRLASGRRRAANPTCAVGTFASDRQGNQGQDRSST